MLPKPTMLEAISPSILQCWRQVLLVSTVVGNSAPYIYSVELVILVSTIEENSAPYIYNRGE